MEVGTSTLTGAVAVVGIALRYPDARTPSEFWENILARRAAFRRMRDERLPLVDYYDANRYVPDKTYGSNAAYMDGYRFDYKGHKINKQCYESTDTVQWLSLDVSGAAIADAGGINTDAERDRTSVIVGNTLTGEESRVASMRLRWPYVRKALIASGRARGLSETKLAELAATMEETYKSAFLPVNEDTLAGALSNTIAGRICNYFDFHGGGFTVDGACSSSLIAVATACTQLLTKQVRQKLAPPPLPVPLSSSAWSYGASCGNVHPQKRQIVPSFLTPSSD